MKTFILTALFTLMLLMPLSLVFTRIVIDSDTAWEDRPLSERILGTVSSVAAWPVFAIPNIGNRYFSRAPSFLLTLLATWMLWSIFLYSFLKGMLWVVSKR